MNKKQNEQKKGRGFYEHKPNREFKASISKDGKYWVFKDITIHVVPRSYISKVELDSLKKQGEGDLFEANNSNSSVEQGNA